MKPKKSALPFLPTALAGDSVQLVINGKVLTYKLLPAQPTFNQMARDCIEANYLREAARNGDLHMAKAIVDRGSLAALNAPGPTSSSALVLAAEHGHDPIVDLLMHARAASVGLCHDALAAMEAAVRNGHPEVLNTLLQATIDFKVSLESKDLLSYAANHGHEAVIAKLLQWGLDPNSVDSKGTNPVTVAAARGHVDAVRTLVHAGADPNFRVVDDVNALMAAVYSGDARTVTALIVAAADTQRPLDLNAPQKLGMTILAIAAAWGYPDVVQALIQAGAAPNLQTSTGSTPLMFAAAHNQKGAIHALVLQGADTGLQTKDDGTTALMIAVMLGHPDAAQALLQAGADPNIANFAGKTALMLAQDGGNPEMIRMLMQADFGAAQMDDSDAVNASCPPTHALPAAEANALEAEVLPVATMASAGDRPMQAAYCADDYKAMNDHCASAHAPAPCDGADGEAANAAPAIAITGAAEEPPQA